MIAGTAAPASRGVERTNAWLFNFRRLVVRYQRKRENIQAFLHLASALVALRKIARAAARAVDGRSRS